MSFEAKKNLARGYIANAPAPPASGLALTLAAGDGALMPAGPFQATVWPPRVAPEIDNAEIILVTSIAGDVVTVGARGQGGTTAKTIEPGWQFAAMATVKAFTDIQDAITAETARAEAAETAAIATAETVAEAAAATVAAADVAVEKARAEGVEVLKAPLASPALTGAPTAPTAAPKDSSTKIATTAFVAAAVAAAVPIAPSGDATGKTDTENIKKALEAGGARLGAAPPSNPFWINETLIVPDGTSGTIADGFLVGVGRGETVLRQAANTNLATPLVTTSNWWNGEGVNTTVPVHIAGLTIDVNVGQQSYLAMPEADAIAGPDGLVVFNNQCDVSRVKVMNPARHAIVNGDQTRTGKNAVSAGYDCNFDDLVVDGYYAVNGAPPSVEECATTEGNPEVTTAKSLAAIKVGMVVAGSNVAPNTTVAAVAAGKITLSQNALTTGVVKLWFGWGQRGFWNANVSGHGCADSYLNECVVRDMWGDFAIKNDNAGDWFVKDCHTYAAAWSGALFKFGNSSTIVDNGFDNIGQAQATGIGATVQLATTEGAFTGGETINTKPLPVKIPKFTLLCMRTAGPGGGPLYFVASNTAPAGATHIPIFNVTAAAEQANGTAIYLPLVGMQAVEGAQTSTYRDNRSEQVEAAGADYVYFAFVGFATAGHSTNIAGNRNFNFSESVNGSTSIGEVYVSAPATYEKVVAAEGGKTFEVSGAKAKGFVNGAEVIFFSVGGVTTPKAGTTYFVINAAANKFELSATKGGAPITVAGAALPETAQLSLQNQVWTIYGASTNTTKGKGLITTTFQANGRNEGAFSAIRTITTAIRNLIEFVDGAPGSSALSAGNKYTFTAEAGTKAGEWMVPVTGWWRLRAAGGGGQGGGGGSPATNVTVSGGGGGAAGLVGETLVFLEAGEVLKWQAGGGGSAAGEGAAAGAGAGKAGSGGSRSFWEKQDGTLIYASGVGGGGGGAGGTAASAGGIPGGKNTNSFTVPGGGGIGLNGGNGETSGGPFGPGALGGGAGGGAAAAAVLGGSGGKAGWSYAGGNTNTAITAAAGGETAKSGTTAGVAGEAAANGVAAGGGGGGAGAWNGGAQGAGAAGGAGGSGWADAVLVG